MAFAAALILSSSQLTGCIGISKQRSEISKSAIRIVPCMAPLREPLAKNPREEDLCPPSMTSQKRHVSLTKRFCVTEPERFPAEGVR